MVLLVAFGGERYLCDVGFGGLTPTAPIKLMADVEQATPHETFRVARLDREFAVEAQVRGQWKRLYRFDLQEQHHVDIELANHYVMSHAESPMQGRLIAARVETDRRFGLVDGTLSTHYLRGASEQRSVASVAELKRLLQETFGIDVPQGRDVAAALERVLAAPQS
jgi:N-hydroxyarylamine O-acetyltransferase